MLLRKYLCKKYTYLCLLLRSPWLNKVILSCKKAHVWNLKILRIQDKILAIATLQFSNLHFNGVFNIYTLINFSVLLLYASLVTSLYRKLNLKNLNFKVLRANKFFVHSQDSSLCICTLRVAWVNLKVISKSVQSISQTKFRTTMGLIYFWRCILIFVHLGVFTRFLFHFLNFCTRDESEFAQVLAQADHIFAWIGAFSIPL